MKRLFFVLTCCMCITLLQAQSVSIENVLKISPSSLSAIKEGSDVKGYYFYYVSDKIDKHTNEYTLRIFDNNMKALKDVKFQDSKDVMILESSFNGTDLIFLFYNQKERTFEYQVYGANGQKKPFNYKRELTKKEKAYLEQTYGSMDDDENTFKGLYPIEGKGFISNTPSREDRDYTFQIDFFSTEKNKQWSFTPTEGAKRFLGDYLGAFNGVVYLEVLKFGSMMDQKPESVIIGLDQETGKQLFEKPTDGKYRFYPASMSQTANGSFLYGEYFDVDGNVMKDKSRGFAFWNVDNKGKIVNEKYVSWESDFGKFVNVSSKGKIEDLGYMYLHNMLQTSDGSIYAVGEGFRKVVSGLGVAAKLLTRNSGMSAMKLKITDMVLIKFDNNFNVKDVKIYDKNSNSVELPSGAELMGAPGLAKIVKYNLGGFDYVYTQANKDASAFSVCYSDYVREKDYKGSTFNSISFNNGKITTDHLNTKSDASRSWVLPAKQGQVLVVDYYRKGKKVEAHFEKLN